MKTAGTPLLWAVFSFIIIAMLMIDLLLQGKKTEKIMTLKDAACWSMLWVSLAMMFNLGFWYHLSQEVGKDLADAQALAFLTGYLIEKALAIDNVFVWLMIFSYFSVPFQLQRRVLILGVLGAILLRVIMIFSGSYLISQFSWLLYVFGAFLVLTGARMALAREDSNSPGNSIVVKWMRKNLRMTSNLEGEKFFVRRNGVLYATPLLLVLIMVEISDVIFAVDSIPAIFAVTTDPFIVLTSNLFAILGLRAMYFLLANVASRFSLLKYGLAFILIFIGIKMLIMDYYHIPVVISLSVVATTLIVTLLINLWVNQRRLNSPDA
ncbi:TerC family protein [Enterobacter kobei]|nr:TerC family protein [Enterobacter kobei]